MDTKERRTPSGAHHSPDPIWRPAPPSAATIELEKAAGFSRRPRGNFSGKIVPGLGLG
jgi:hypothetical protein